MFQLVARRLVFPANEYVRLIDLGTLGKFATDSGLYNDLRATTQSMKNLLDELQKHPGKVPVTVKIF